MAGLIIRCFILVFCAVALSSFARQGQDIFPCDRAVEVFHAGVGNPYSSIRIPSLLPTGDGHLLAFAEGRYKNADQGENDIIVSASSDGGRTWSSPRVIVRAHGANFNNPCPVFDADTGAVTVVFQRYPAGVRERQANIPQGWDDEGCVRNFMVRSRDRGATWEEPADITRTTKRPTGVDIMAFGPNAGIQLQEGPHKGRLVIPMNEGPFGKWTVSCIYSDDGGATWKQGQPTENMNGLVNETSLAETGQGGVVLVARHWGKGNCRRIVWSDDGGVTWGQVEDAPELFCDSTQNSLLTYSLAGQPEYGNKNRILFSAPSAGRRIKGQLAMSYDNGKTWPVKKLLGNGGFAYSSLAMVAPGVVGVLYEEDGECIKKLKFAPVAIEWLTDGKDTGLAPGAKVPSVQ